MEGDWDWEEGLALLGLDGVTADWGCVLMKGGCLFGACCDGDGSGKEWERGGGHTFSARLGFKI